MVEPEALGGLWSRSQETLVQILSHTDTLPILIALCQRNAKVA